jgi:hypothetical protein
MRAIFSFETSNMDSGSFFDELNFKIDSLSDPEKEDFEERAAVMEYDGQLSREEAEWRALRIIFENRIKIAV